jgi:hypothetical protein
VEPGRHEGGSFRGGGCGSLHGCKGGSEASLACISDGRHGGGRKWGSVFLRGIHLVLSSLSTALACWWLVVPFPVGCGRGQCSQHCC